MNGYSERVAQRTAKLFRVDKLNCGESVLKGLLEEAGYFCPQKLVSMAAPFGRGMGGSGCVCGALAGGQMALGYLLGCREEACTAETRDRIAKTLHDSFVRYSRATCCRILHKGLPYGTDKQFEACAKRAEEAAGMAAGIFMEFLPDVIKERQTEVSIELP